MTDELKCFKCKLIVDNGPGQKGRMKGEKFQCQSCADIEDKAKNDKEKKKQWDAERKKEKEHVKKNPDCSCDICKQERGPTKK